MICYMVLWATSCTNMQMTSPSHRNFHFAPKYVCYNHLQFHQTTELFVQTFVCTFFRQIFSVCVFLLSGIKKIIEWNKCLLKNFCRKYVLLVPRQLRNKRPSNEWMNAIVAAAIIVVHVMGLMKLIRRHYISTTTYVPFF